MGPIKLGGLGKLTWLCLWDKLVSDLYGESMLPQIRNEPNHLHCLSGGHISSQMTYFVMIKLHLPHTEDDIRLDPQGIKP